MDKMGRPLGPSAQGTAAEIASRLYGTELALVAELLARGGADYLSAWSFGNGRLIRYGRRPILTQDYSSVRTWQVTFGPGSMPLRPQNNPLVEQLFAARKCKYVLGFNDIDFAREVYEIANDLQRKQIATAHLKPRALQPTMPLGEKP